jgi:hypothetical protein
LLIGLFPKDVKNQTQKNAKKNAGCQWEVEREVAPLDPDIAGQPAQMDEREELRIVQQNSRDEQREPEDNQQFAHVLRGFEP